MATSGKRGGSGAERSPERKARGLNNANTVALGRAATGSDLDSELSSTASVDDLRKSTGVPGPGGISDATKERWRQRHIDHSPIPRTVRSPQGNTGTYFNGGPTTWDV